MDNVVTVKVRRKDNQAFTTFRIMKELVGYRIVYNDGIGEKHRSCASFVDAYKFCKGYNWYNQKDQIVMVSGLVALWS